MLQQGKGSVAQVRGSRWPRIDIFAVRLAESRSLSRSSHVRGKGCAHDFKTCRCRVLFPYLPVRTQAFDKGTAMADSLNSYPHFRLNFEQQGKRAKELLKAARAGDPRALERFKSIPKLAEAQYLIAQELRFENWAALKRHVAELTLAREAASLDALDGDLRTLHVRCGRDLQHPL
jgi:hypothetical protein